MNTEGFENLEPSKDGREALAEWSPFDHETLRTALEHHGKVLALASPGAPAVGESATESAGPTQAWVLTGAEFDSAGRLLRYTGYDTEAPDVPRQWTPQELEQAVAQSGVERPLLLTPGEATDVSAPQKTHGPGHAAITFRGYYGNYGFCTPGSCSGWATDGMWTC